MTALDSSVDLVALKRVRGLLKAPVVSDSPLGALAAAAFFAFTAIGLALVVITSPPPHSTHQPTATQQP